MRGVDGDGDSNRRKGSIKNASESEEKGEGWGEISDDIARSNDSRKGKGLTRKRSNSAP